MDKKIYIIAGNIQEFNEYVRRYAKDRKDSQRYSYISKVEDLYGISATKDQIEFIGTYYIRRDLKEITERVYRITLERPTDIITNF